MLVQRTDNQVQITISSKVDGFGLQKLLDYIHYLEATANSKATQKEVDKLADEVNEAWWEKNKTRFLKWE